FQTAVMAMGATIAAGLSYPLVVDANLGWQDGLVVWSGLALVAVFLWIPQLVKKKQSKPKPVAAVQSKNKLTKSPLVWHLSIFMGLQSLTYYVVLAWLPSIIIDLGYDSAFAGKMLSLSQGVNILGSLVIPYWAGKRKDQRLVLVVLVVLELIGLLGLMFNLGSVIIWSALLGVITGGCFGLALLLIILRSPDTQTTTVLSGFVQSVGYFIAATGPFLVGVILDFPQVWNYSLGFLLLLCFWKFYTGGKAARNKSVKSDGRI